MTELVLTPEVIKDIHNFAETVSDAAVSKQSKNPEVLSKIAKYGFKQIDELRLALNPEELEMYHTCKIKAPQYAFMTLKQVQELCKNYGLVYGEAFTLREGIPLKNMQDIINFVETADKSVLENQERRVVLDAASGESLQIKRKGFIEFFRKFYVGEHINNLETYFDDINTNNTEGNDNFLNTISKLAESVISKSNSDECFEYPTFYVIATRSSFNENAGSVVNFKYNVSATDKESGEITDFESSGRDINREDILPQPIGWTQGNDPIVLAKLTTGFLVITAWGDEINIGSNPQHN